MAEATESAHEDRETDATSERPRSDRDAHLATLESFGARSARLCRLMRKGRLSPERCYLAIAQLWIQLSRSERRARSSEEQGR